jgi:hypothetical protein
LWSGCGGERDATPLGWQCANIEGRGIWKVGALRRIRVVVKNGSNTDLITGFDHVMPTSCRRRCSRRAKTENLAECA